MSQLLATVVRGERTVKKIKTKKGSLQTTSTKLPFLIAEQPL